MDNADKLKQRASELVQNLHASGVQAEVIQDSLRDYSIKVFLSWGRLVIYYSPKKDTFKCQDENINDEELWRRVLMCWNEEKGPDIPTAQTDFKQIDAYVDGSFAHETTAYGVVVAHQDTMLWEDSGTVLEDTDGTRQVAGELQAVLKALVWCKGNGIESVNIHYCYKGVENWATDEWRANKAVTQQYRDTVQSSGIQIAWKKVDANSGIKWNEHAAELARSATLASRQDSHLPVDAMMQLETVIQKFREYLQRFTITLEVKRRSENPSPHVQLSISSGDDVWGYLNFYCPVGESPYPKFHEVGSAEGKLEIENLWVAFTSPSESDFCEIDHYYKILEPYGGLNFDFRALAEAVARVWNQKMKDPLDIDCVRYDFLELKRCREALIRNVRNEI